MQAVSFGYGKAPEMLAVRDFSMVRGERVFLKGPSGSGKSTFLGLVAGVLQPRSGELTVAGHDFAALSAARRDGVRASDIGVIFQIFNLLPYLSLIENVMLPCRFSAARDAVARERSGSVREEAIRLLERLGLGAHDIQTTPVSNLSVGQQQRGAAARALIGDPALILADEPTSALDTDARDAFLALLLEEAGRSGAGLLFVSHDRSLAERFDRSVDLTTLNAAGHAKVSAA